MPVETLTPQPQTEFKARVARTYTMDFDEQAATALQGYSKSPEFGLRKDQFSNYILMNMETHLGERFNVNLSSFEYDIKDGQMWGKDMDVPALSSFEKGRDARRKDGNWVDFDREDAEIEGFKKIEALLCDPNTQIGTIMLSISPPGLDRSSYKHRFHDVFTLRERNGVRFVEARRYASGLNLQEYKSRLTPFGEIDIDGCDPAAKLLANPLEIPNIMTPDALHDYLHKEKGYLDDRVFEVIKKQCRGLAVEYVNSLLKNPKNRQDHAQWFNAYLNKADKVLRLIGQHGIEAVDKVRSVNTKEYLEQEKQEFAFMPVRTVMTGCGASGGYETQITSAFGVAEFSRDFYGERSFNCPTCNKENIRPANQLLPRCLHCGSDKVAC